MTVYVPEGEGTFTEEERSRRPTVFSVLREITAAFGCADPHLGLYGAFGYDLAFQFEPVRLAIERPADQRDLVLHLPDEIWVVDLRREEAIRYSYEFTVPRALAPVPGRRGLDGGPAQGDAGHAGPRARCRGTPAAARPRPVRGGRGAGEGAVQVR